MMSSRVELVLKVLLLNLILSGLVDVDISRRDKSRTCVIEV